MKKKIIIFIIFLYRKPLVTFCGFLPVSYVNMKYKNRLKNEIRTVKYIQF